MMNDYLIYKFTSPSGKSYIGMTKNLEKRINSHKSSSNGCKFFNRAIKKYGFENFEMTILIKNITKDEAIFYEKKYIAEYKTMKPFGYNLTFGGDGMFGYKFSNESKQKMREKKIGKKLSDETKMKIGLASVGRKPNEETRKKLSNAQKGNKKSLGRILSQESREKISKANKGKSKNMSKESREKAIKALREVLCKKVFCIELNQTFNSVSDAVLKTGAHHVGHVCNGKRKKSNNLTFRFIENP